MHTHLAAGVLAVCIYSRQQAALAGCQPRCFQPQAGGCCLHQAAAVDEAVVSVDVGAAVACQGLALGAKHLFMFWGEMCTGTKQRRQSSLSDDCQDQNVTKLAT